MCHGASHINNSAGGAGVEGGVGEVCSRGAGGGGGAREVGGNFTAPSYAVRP